MIHLHVASPPDVTGTLLPVLHSEPAVMNLRELVCYAVDGGVLCRSAAQARAAPGRYARSRRRWSLVLHPDRTNLAEIISFLYLGGGFCPALFHCGLERGVVAFVLVGVGFGEVGDRLVEFG